MAAPWERDWSGGSATQQPSNAVTQAQVAAPAQPRPWERDWAATRSPVDAPLLREDKTEFTRGIASGVDQLQGAVYGLAGLVGETSGSDGLRDWGLAGYESNQKQAAAVGPRISSLSQIDDVGDFMDAASGWVGQAVPSLVTAAGSGGVGGYVGKTVATRAATRLAEKGVSKKAAELAVQRALASPAMRKQIMAGIKKGAGTGMYLTGAGQAQGELFGQLKEAGIEDAALPAWAFGAAQGALDVIPEFAIAKKLLPGQVEKALTDSFARGVGKASAQQAVMEGGTEGAQQALGIFARITSGGADWNDADTQGVLDSMAAGAIVGTVVGAPAEVASRLQARKPKEEAAGKPKNEQAPAAQASQPARPAPVRSPQQPPSAAPQGPTPQAPSAAEVAPTQQAPAQPFVAPSAEPRADLDAQMRDVADPANPRKGLYMSAANVEAHPDFQRPPGMAMIVNADGQGGVMFAKPSDANAFEKRRRAGEPLEKLVGEYTMSGDGKPSDPGAVVVQQKTADGAVTRESVVVPGTTTAAETMQSMEAPDRSVEVTTPDDAIARRETQGALAKLNAAREQALQTREVLPLQQEIQIRNAMMERGASPQQVAGAVRAAGMQRRQPVETTNDELSFDINSDMDEVARWDAEASGTPTSGIARWEQEQIAKQEASRQSAPEAIETADEPDAEAELGKVDASLPFTYIGIGNRTHGEQKVLSARELQEGKPKAYVAMPYRGEDGQSKAEALAKQRQKQDPDATYVARYVNGLEASERGLNGPGWYVSVYQHASTDMGYAHVTGGPRTERQITQIFLQRAKERWDRLSLRQKTPEKGDPVYGFKAGLIDADGKPVLDSKGKPKTVNIAASEIVALGQSVNPELRGNDAMSIRDAFREGLARLMLYVDEDGNRLLPENFASGRASFSRHLVLRDQFKRGSSSIERMTLGDAHTHAKEQSRATAPEVQARPGEEFAVAREREVYRGWRQPVEGAAITPAEQGKPQTVFIPPNATDQSPAFYGIDRPDPTQDAEAELSTPAFENRNADSGVDTRGYETEADQNARSLGQLATDTSGTVRDGGNSAMGTVRAGRAQTTVNAPKPVRVKMADAESSRLWSQVSEAIRKELGLHNRIVVTDNVTDLARFASEDGAWALANKIGNQVSDRGERGLPNGFVGHANGVSYIFLNPELFAGGKTPASAIKVLSHELGHVFFKQHMESAEPAMKKAMWDAFETAQDAGSASAKRELDADGKPMNRIGQFEEWFADQVAGWVASKRAPQNAVEQFFKSLADKFEKIWAVVRKHFPLDESAEAFIEASIKRGGGVDDAFDSLGEANHIMHDSTVLPEEPSSPMRRVWDSARAIKTKHPKAGALLDFVGESAMAMHNGLTASLQARIHRMNIPAFSEIVSHFHLRAGDEGGFTYNAAVANRMRNFITDYDKIVSTVKNKSEFLELMRSEKAIDELPPKYREAATQFRDFMNRLHAYQREAHLPIGKVGNYFPQIADVDELKKPDAVDVIFQALQKAGINTIDGKAYGLTRQEVQEMITNMTDDSFAVDFDPSQIEDTAGNMRSPFQQALRSRTMPKDVRDAIRNIKNEDGQSRFYNKDLDSTIHRYVRDAVRRSEYNKRFGDTEWDTDSNLNQEEPRKFDPFYQFNSLMQQARKEGATVDQQATMFDSMSAFMGQYNRIKSEPLRQLTRSVQFYQNLRTLLLVTMSSLPEFATIFLRAGNFGDAWRTIRSTAADSFKKGGNTSKLLRAYGFAVDELDAMAFDEFKQASDYNSKLDRANETWFRMTGLTRWTNFMRGLSLNVSLDYLRDHAHRIANDLDTDGDSARRIQELGLTIEDLKAWAEAGEPVYGQAGVTQEDVRLNRSEHTLNQVDAAEKVTGAVTRLINEMVVNPTAAMKPLWRSDERFSLVSQLGSFTYGFTNQVLGRVWHELTRDGATTSQRAQVMLSIAMMLPLVALGIELKEILQYRIFGNDGPTDDMSTPAYLSQLIQRSGVTGIAQLGIDAGNTAGHNKSPLLAFVGPTLGQVSDAFTQPAYKTMPGAIPLISQIPGLRDPLKEALK